MQFPWACESFKNNYSQAIANCYTSATEYMPMTQEWEQTKSTLIGALKSKAKKLSVFNNKNVTVNTSTSFSRNSRSKSQLNMSKSRRSMKIPRRRNNRRIIGGKSNQLYATKSYLNTGVLHRLNDDINPLRMSRLPPLKRKERLDVSKYIKTSRNRGELSFRGSRIRKQRK